MRGMRGLESRPGLSGLYAHPLVDRGQVLRGAKQRNACIVATPGEASFAAPASGWYDILLYGPGGTGGSSAGTAASGGGGGGAALKRVWLRGGEVVTYTVAVSGAPTNAAVAGRFAFSAASGGAGATGFVPGGVGGLGFGGDVNRSGGHGEGTMNPDGDSGTEDGIGVLPAAGELGGSGGVGPSGAGIGAYAGGGGGGGAGFRDMLPSLVGDGGSGYSDYPMSAPGGGGYGVVSGGGPGATGANGAIVVIYAR